MLSPIYYCSMASQRIEKEYKKRMKEEMDSIMNECDEIFPPFSLEELDDGIKTLKTRQSIWL